MGCLNERKYFLKIAKIASETFEKAEGRVSKALSKVSLVKEFITGLTVNVNERIRKQIGSRKPPS